MNLPFTVDQFIGVFRDYNLAIWPMQVVMYVLALIAVVFAFRKIRSTNRYISLILAIMWVWNGFMYHIVHFTTINKAAFLFGALFILQGIVFTWYVVKNNIKYSTDNRSYQIIGCLFILYAAVIYPIIGALVGHGYPNSPLLGVAPCPTTIFTMGFLLLAAESLPLKVIWIPFIWSLIGFSAALTLGIQEDIGLLITGLVTTVIIVYTKLAIRKTKQSL